MTMNQAQLIEKFQARPPDKQVEVYHFVDHLHEMNATVNDPNSVDNEWIAAEFSDMSLHQALRGMEDEQPPYTVDDLKERSQ